MQFISLLNIFTLSVRSLFVICLQQLLLLLDYLLLMQVQNKNRNRVYF